MIAIASSDARERNAFAALSEGHGWAVLACDSLRALQRGLGRHSPRIVLTRHRLNDGYSDNIFPTLTAARLLPKTKVIVLMAAGSPSATEARQLALGADCVLRDPVRTDVLLAYLTKYSSGSPGSATRSASARPTKPLHFAGAILRRADRSFQRGRHAFALTPREVQLVELLLHSRGDVVSYEALFTEILGRPYRGDTSNMRVLLGKLGSSAARVGIALRDWVEVIPKAGYRYRGVRRAAPHLKRSRSPLLRAA